MTDALPKRVEPNSRIRRPLYTVGAGVLVLGQVYDADQYWLPFVTAVFPTPEARDPIEDALTDKLLSRKLRRRIKNPHATISHRNQYIAIFEKGVHQHVLPFDEFRRVSHGENDRLREADYPTWDRDKKGEILRLGFSIQQRQEVIEWCKENCTARFYPKDMSVYFASALDLVCARMVFYTPGQ